MFTREELRALWPFYLSRLVHSLFSVIAAYETIYFLDRGLSVFQISILIGTIMIASVISDIPTGAFADIYGRKASVLVRYFVIAILLALVPLTSSFTALLLLFIIWGIAASFSSGAQDAWVVDSLRKKRKMHLLDRFYAHHMALMFSGVIVGPLIGAFLVKRYDMSLLWYIEAAGMLCSGLVLVFIKEEFKRKDVAWRDMIRHTWKQAGVARRFVLRTTNVRRLTIASFCIMLSFSVMQLLWQPYLKGLNMPLEYFGYILSAVGLLNIGVPVLARIWAAKFAQPTNYLLIMTASLGLALLMFLFSPTIMAAAALIILIYTLITFSMPVESALFQRQIRGQMRASVGSFRSTSDSIGIGIGLVIMGLLADMLSPGYIIGLTAVFLIPASVIYWRMGQAS